MLSVSYQARNEPSRQEKQYDERVQRNEREHQRRVAEEARRDALDMWLVCYFGGATGIRQINPGASNPNRATSAQIESNLRWLEAMQDPDAARSHARLNFVVTELMPVKEPDKFELISSIYIESCDYAAPERWKRSQGRKGLYADLEDAKNWILERLGTEPLHIPDPEQAQDFVAKSRQKQSKARSVYHTTRTELESRGASPSMADGQARQQAAKASGYSVRQMRRIIPPLQQRNRRPKT